MYPNFHYALYVILVMAILNSLSIAAPTKNSNTDCIECNDNWDQLPNLETLTTSTEASLPSELSCKAIHNEFKEDLSIAFKEEITELLGTYNDWGKLLAPAPVAIGILGQLIFMANQLKDFPINGKDQGEIFKHIKYPSSFRTTLLQISQQGFSAFLLAHRNMDAIRFHNSVVPSDIKDAVRYLLSNNTNMIKLRLPVTLAKINATAEKSQQLSKEVVDEFNLVLELIDETNLAVSSTQMGVEKRLKLIKLDIELQNVARNYSEMESLILKAKEHKMMEVMKTLEDRKNKLYFTTVYKNVQFTINLAKNWVAEMGQDRYNKDKTFLHNTRNTWMYTYYDEIMDSNPCAQKNSQQLLDLLIAFGEYRTSYEHWQTSQNRLTTPFNGSRVINTFERLLGELKQCPDINNLISKGVDLMKEIKDPNSFQLISKTSRRPGEAKINNMIIMINSLRTAAKDVKWKSGKQRKIVTNSAWNMYNVSKHYQLSQLRNMFKTIQDIVKLNKELMEIRKKKTKEILDRISSLNLAKVDIEYVLRALKEGLMELRKLKNDWESLIQFFKNIGIFITSASRHSTGLVEIVQSLSGNFLTVQENKLLFNELMDNIEKSTQAAFLVHGIADMYVNVSNLYIMDRVTRLNTLNSMRIDGATQEQLKTEKEMLTKNATIASYGIEDYVRRHEKQLSEELAKRHLEVFNEYEKFIECLEKKRLVTQPSVVIINSNWFQLKSRLNDKVLSVSSDNQLTVATVHTPITDNLHQLWYLDQEEIIHSAATNFCLTLDPSSLNVTVEKCDKMKNQKWKIFDDKIINEDNRNRVRCLGISRWNNVLSYSCRSNIDQLWDVVKPQKIEPTTSTVSPVSENGPTDPDESQPTEDLPTGTDYYDENEPSERQLATSTTSPIFVNPPTEVSPNESDNEHRDYYDENEPSERQLATSTTSPIFVNPSIEFSPTESDNEPLERQPLSTKTVSSTVSPFSDNGPIQVFETTTSPTETDDYNEEYYEY